MRGISKRHFLREKEAQKLMDEMSKVMKIQIKNIIGKNRKIELADFGETKIFLFELKPLFAFYKNNWIPTLIFKEALDLIPKIVVDMGAVPHICNGADVMVPGILKVEGEFHKGELVVILDEKHNKPIAVGAALKDSKEIIKMKHGKVVKNVHFVGDKLWKLIKSLH